MQTLEIWVTFSLPQISWIMSGRSARPRTLNRRCMHYRAVRLKMLGFLCLSYLYATGLLQVWRKKDCKVLILSSNKGYKDLEQK